MLDTGSSITTVRLAVVKRICRNRGGGTLPGIRGIDNKIVTVVDEIPLKICFKDARVSLENVAVVKMAPFPIILAVDWLVKANVNLVCKGNQIVPVFLSDLKENVENSLPCTTVPVEEEEAVSSEEFFEELAKELPPKRRKDAVRFSIKKAVEVPGESLRMLDGSIPFDFTGTGIVRFGFSAKPSRTWVVPSALVSFKNGRARVPLLNFDSNPVTVKRSNCLIFIDVDIGAQVAVVPLERKEAELSPRGGPARVSCAAVGMDRRAASRDDMSTSTWDPTSLGPKGRRSLNCSTVIRSVSLRRRTNWAEQPTSNTTSTLVTIVQLLVARIEFLSLKGKLFRKR